MTNLSPSAKGALDRVAKAHMSYKLARENFEAELQQELDAKLESYVTERSTAVRLADIAGVPRTQIGRAMGTTNYRTVQDILEEATETVDITQSVDKNWTVHPCGDGTFDISVTNLGAGGVSGNANVKLANGELEFLDGDHFVVPQLYRNDLAGDIIKAIG